MAARHAEGGSQTPMINRGGRARVVWLLALVAALAVLMYAVTLGLRPPWHGFFDLTIYRGAGRWWLDGRPLYAYIRPHTISFGFTYPPFALLCLLPLAWLPGTAA